MNEPLGVKECPYAYRWMLNLGLFSVRVHHWVRSDDKRYFHDHPWAFITIILKGGYTDVSWRGDIDGLKKDISARHGNLTLSDDKKYIVEKDTVIAGNWRYRPSSHRHYVDVPKGGCWSLLFCSYPVRNWGFWVNGKFYRPLRFFSRHGHPPCDEQ
jgi:hypothetical protein